MLRRMRAKALKFNREVEAAKEYIQEGGNLTNTLGLLAALARSSANRDVEGDDEGGDEGAAGGSGAQAGGSGVQAGGSGYQDPDYDSPSSSDED